MYKSGDKLVIKIDEDDASDLNKGYSPHFYDEQILGKLEDFIPAEEKIKMTVEEKKEFDKLKENDSTLYGAMEHMGNILNSYLYISLFENKTIEENNKAQLEFSRAWEKPSRIEAVKEKKYYAHLLENNLSEYLNYNTRIKQYCTGTKRESDCYKTKFTKSEIAKMHFDNFKITNKALEEVEDE